MKKALANILSLCLLAVLCGCSGYNKVVKASDYATKYSLAKSLYAKGSYTNCSTMLEECVAMLRGTPQDEESLFMLASCYFNLEDYFSAAQYFETCYKRFPNSSYSENSLFMNGKSLFLDMPDPRLDASSTFGAISSLQLFVETYPRSRFRPEAENMINGLYDRLVEKEKKSAELYYNLGNYLGNNYRSCIIVAENALREYPYSKYREDLSMLILKAKFQMAEESVESKREERYRDAIDEYYAFRNDYPDSKYSKEADKIFRTSSKNLNNKNLNSEE